MPKIKYDGVRVSCALELIVWFKIEVSIWHTGLFDMHNNNNKQTSQQNKRVHAAYDNKL